MGNRSSKSANANRLSEQEAWKRRASSAEFMEMDNINQVIDMCEWDFAQPTTTGMLAEALQGFSAVRAQEKLFLEAESFQEQALPLLEKSYGRSHPVVAECLLSGAQSRTSLGRLEDTMREWRGPNPLSVTKYEEALEYSEQALEIYDKYRGRDKPKHIARCKIQIGDCYLLLLDGKRAVETWQSAHEKCEEIDPVPQELLSLALFGVACAARLFGDETPQRCVALHAEALKVLQATNNFKIVAECLVEHAKIYTELNFLGKAIEALKQAVEIHQSVFGEHEETADTISLLGEAMYSNGEYNEAATTADSAMQMYQQVMGEDSLKYAKAMSNVALAYYSLPERLDDAMELYQKVLQIFSGIVGDKHFSVGATYNSMGSVRFAQKDSIDAMQYYEKALKLYVDLYGQEHASVAISYNNMAAVRRMENRFRESASLYRKSMDIRSKTLGQDHKSTGLTMNSIGEVELERKQYDEAMTMFTQARFILAKSLGPDHPTVARITSNMGEASHGRGQYAAAMQNFSQSLDIRKKHLGEDHPEVIATLRAMEQVHKQMLLHEQDREKEMLEKRRRRTEALQDGEPEKTQEKAQPKARLTAKEKAKKSRTMALR